MTKKTKMQQRIEAAKALAKAKKNGTVKAAPMNTEKAKAMNMGYAFEAELGYYLHKPTLQYFSKLGANGFTKSTLTMLSRAVTLAEKYNVDYQTYMKAQFYWFHKWFRRPPRLFEITGGKGKYPAERRLREYIELKPSEEVSSMVMPTTGIEKETLDKINEKRLEQLSEIWDKTEEEVLRLFSEVFDPAWLKRNPVYQKLQAQKK
jgi:hypothetical protein